jgi:tetratricopeptide (TPR) repeat protein
MSENLGNQKQPLKNVVSFSLPKDYFFEKGMKAFQKNETDQAVYYLKRAAEDEENPTVLVEIARKLLALSQYQMGITILEYTLDKQPANEDVYYLLAYAFFELGLFQKANIYAQKYMDIGTDEDQLEELEDYLDVIQSEEDDDLSINDELLVLQERVTNYLANHDWKSAKTTLLTIVDRYQDFWPAYNNLALVELHLGNHEEAIRVLYYVLEHNPGNLSALIHLTMLKRLIGQEKEAFEQLVSFENIVPISEEHRHKLGVLFYQFQQHEQAFRLFHLLYLERPQRELQFYYMYCDAAYRCGRQEYAEKVWNYEIGNSEEDGEQYPWSEKKHTTSEIENLMTDTEFQSQFAKTNSERWGLIYFMKEYYYLQKFISVLEELPELDLIGIDADLEQVLLQNVCYMEPHPSIQIVLNGAKTIQATWDEEYVNLRDHLQLWFYSVCELTIKYNELPIDEKVLLAATHYLTAKKDSNVSQKEIAAHYKISTYLLKKGVDYIKNIF